MTNTSKSPLLIEPSTASDIAQITNIYEQAVLHGTASFELSAPDEAEMSRRRQALIDGNYPYIIARIDNQIAGYAYAGPYHNRPGYKWSVENSIYVNPNFQKRGVGSTLLKHLIEICTNKGYRQMIAVIGDSSNTGSIALHEKYGFALVGVNKAVGRKFDKWLDVVMMQRELGAGAGSVPEELK